MCDTKKEWGQQLNTYRDDVVIPTCRLQYISNHPTTKLANLHSTDSMIAPTWAKVSQSVWASSSYLCGGYGRRLQRSSISTDAPTYFNNPTVQYNCDVPPPGRKATITRATNRVFIENESAYVLPGGKSILSATLASKASNTMYSRRQQSRQFPHGNQTLLENLDPGRLSPHTPIDWNSSTLNDKEYYRPTSRTSTSSRPGTSRTSMSGSARNSARGGTPRPSTSYA